MEGERRVFGSARQFFCVWKREVGRKGNVEGDQLVSLCAHEQKTMKPYAVQTFFVESCLGSFWLASAVDRNIGSILPNTVRGADRVGVKR